MQYSQVEQSIQQTGVLRGMLARLSSSDMADAAALIGREVEFDSAVAGLSDAPAAWSWSASRKLASLSGEIVDSSGRVVATVALDPAGATGKFRWDGRLSSGGMAPQGAYVLKLSVADAAGASVPVAVHSVGQVGQVVQSNGELWLDTGGVSLPMRELVKVAAKPV